MRAGWVGVKWFIEKELTTVAGCELLEFCLYKFGFILTKGREKLLR